MLGACQLADMALKIKTVTIPKKVGCTGGNVSPNLGTSVYIWAELHKPDWRTFCQFQGRGPSQEEWGGGDSKIR